MLKKYKFEKLSIAPDMKECLYQAKNQLSKNQLLIKEEKIPVIVLFEGWGSAGIGTTIGKVIMHMDPRFYQVETMSKKTDEDKRKPFLYRYFYRIPEVGKVTFYDHGWMQEVTTQYLQGDLTKKEYNNKIESINNFERTLSDNGYIIVKFFFHISEKDQKKRMDHLTDDKNSAWRVPKQEKWENKHYNKCLKVYDDYIDKTNSTYAPWFVIDATNKTLAQLQVLEMLNSKIENRSFNKSPIIENRYEMSERLQLKDVDLSLSISDEDYTKELKACRKRLKELHNIIYRKKIPIIIGYEGWDAAGKGGNIKRLSSGLDPRGFTVYPIASPDQSELNRHYLWRFYKRLPKDGHIAIFDRTWYGRVMVERLEGLCGDDWRMAYNEINEFEKELYDWGAIIIKFWVDIDKETQLERFNDRMNTPEKRWKITDEDWRNRDKWDAYEESVDEMLLKTNTTYAPWYILESNDKKYARIKAMKIVISEIEKRL